MSKTNVVKFVPLSDLDDQENLTVEKIKSVCKSSRASTKLINQLDIVRPKDSYSELIKWVENMFASNIGANRTNFVHNKIIIDGQFLQFCKEQNVIVNSLYDDSVVSWRSDFDNEKFFMQGVFLIKQKNAKFIHFALFQKGNQNEDEISFGILVDDENYDAYIILRNEYDDWVNNRDRINLQIRVIDGEDISYERDSKWEDIFLPNALKTSIKQTIEGFLNSREIYEEQGIAWRRGIIFHGHQGNGKSSLIKTIISNYDFKPVTVLPSANDDSMRDAFAYAEMQNPALLFFEDLDSLLQNVNASLFLNLMDGITSRNGILIVATANNLNAFADNIKDRPSRFDRKFEIPLPDEDMSSKYIKKWFGKTISNKEILKLAAFTFKNKFSYAYIKELYISSVYIAIAENRQKPTLADVNVAMSQLIADKFGKGSKKVGIDKYLNSDKKSK
jgi:ATP-dependent 26S proteasome regulatory subunit